MLVILMKDLTAVETHTVREQLEIGAAKALIRRIRDGSEGLGVTDGFHVAPRQGSRAPFLRTAHGKLVGCRHLRLNTIFAERVSTENQGVARLLHRL